MDRIGVVGSSNPDERLGMKVLVYGMQRKSEYAAVPFPVLEKHPVLNTKAFGSPIVIFSPPDENAAMAFERTLDGKTLIFEQIHDGKRLMVKDATTGSTWSWDEGTCIHGPFEGRKLSRIQGLAVYWGVWARFHPKTALIRGQD